MNSRIVAPLSSATPREDWLRAGVLAGFLATFAMTAVLVAAYWLADAIGNSDTVARDVIKAENIVDFTTKENFADRIAKRLGVGAMSALGFSAHTNGVNLR